MDDQAQSFPTIRLGRATRLAQLREQVTPEINAASTIVILVSMALLLGVARFYRFGGER
jgi:ABC-type spermidine/putrescine transport system permease subunit II